MMQLEMSAQALMRKYADEQHLFLPKFVTLEQIHALKAETSDWAVRRVTCGHEAISWGEQAIPKYSQLFQFFNAQTMLDFIKGALGLDQIPADYRTTCWTSVYGEGEYINPHKDAAGTTQMLVCLEAAPQENGGHLMLNFNNQESALCLQPGDAILFCATKIEHWTTPLKASASCPNPKRVVAVGRYFFTAPNGG